MSVYRVCAVVLCDQNCDQNAGSICVLYASTCVFQLLSALLAPPQLTLQCQMSLPRQ